MNQRQTETSTPVASWVLAAVLLVILLICGVFWYTTCDRKLVLVALALFGLVPLVVSVLHTVGVLAPMRRRLVAFGAVLTYACILFALFLPPFSAPDEYHHYLASYWLSDCVAGASTVNSPETLAMRADDWAFYSDHGRRDESADYQTFTINAASYQQIAEEFSWGPQLEGDVMVPEELMFSFTLGNENVIAKIGSVVGILLGKALNVGAYPLFYLGRIFSALFFVACVVAAVHITPVGKNAMMAISLLPMTLHEAASFSYDGGTIGLSFLFIALALSALFGEGKLGRPTMVGLAVSAVCLAPCKAVYVLELALVLFIPTRRFSSRGQALVYKGAVLGASALAVAVAKLATVASVSGGTTVFVFPGERTYSISDLLLHPFHTLALFFRTLEVSGDSYLSGIVGSNLGWLQQNLGTPMVFIGTYVIGLLYAAQKSDDDALIVGMRLRVLSTLVCLAVLLAVMLSMTLAWTPASMDVIQGVQGRYLLPVLPLALLALRARRVAIAGDTFPTTLVLFSLLNALYMTRFMALALLA